MKTHFLLSGLVLVVALSTTRSSLAWDDNTDFDRESLKLKDRVVMQSGECLNGTVVKDEQDKKAPVVFRTLDGIQLELDRKLISRVEKVDAVAARYNQQLATLTDTAAAHSDMVTWCKEQPKGSTRFRDQIQFHNKRIVSLDPDNKAARRALGYTFLSDENRWVEEDKFWAGQGYVKQGGRWVPELLDRIDQQSERNNEVYSAKKQQFNLWKRNLSRMSGAAAVANLLAIVDNSIIGDVYEAYKAEKNLAYRSVYIEVFASARPVHSLQVRALVDAVISSSSDKAVDYLLQEDFNQRLAAEYLTRYLKDKNNAKIQRAAYVLGELESQYSILALANALQTEHQIIPGSNGRMGAGFNNTGGGIQQFGSQKPVKKMFKNIEVLTALKKITGQDFGYVKKAYQRWYLDNYTVVGMKARR